MELSGIIKERKSNMGKNNKNKNKNANKAATQAASEDATTPTEATPVEETKGQDT